MCCSRRHSGTQRPAKRDTSPKRKRGHGANSLACASASVGAPANQTEPWPLHESIRRFRQEAAVRYRPIG